MDPPPLSLPRGLFGVAARCLTLLWPAADVVSLSLGSRAEPGDPADARLREQHQPQTFSSASFLRRQNRARGRGRGMMSRQSSHSHWREVDHEASTAKPQAPSGAARARPQDQEERNHHRQILQRSPDGAVLRMSLSEALAQEQQSLPMPKRCGLYEYNNEMLKKPIWRSCSSLYAPPPPAGAADRSFSSRTADGASEEQVGGARTGGGPIHEHEREEPPEHFSAQLLGVDDLPTIWENNEQDGEDVHQVLRPALAELLSEPPEVENENEDHINQAEEQVVEDEEEEEALRLKATASALRKTAELAIAVLQIAENQLQAANEMSSTGTTPTSHDRGMKMSKQPQPPTPDSVPMPLGLILRQVAKQLRQNISVQSLAAHSTVILGVLEQVDARLSLCSESVRANRANQQQQQQRLRAGDRQTDHQHQQDPPCWVGLEEAMLVEPSIDCTEGTERRVAACYSVPGGEQTDHQDDVLRHDREEDRDALAPHFPRHLTRHFLMSNICPREHRGWRLFQNLTAVVKQICQAVYPGIKSVRFVPAACPGGPHSAIVTFDSDALGERFYDDLVAPPQDSASASASSSLLYPSPPCFAPSGSTSRKQMFINLWRKTFHNLPKVELELRSSCRNQINYTTTRPNIMHGRTRTDEGDHVEEEEGSGRVHASAHFLHPDRGTNLEGALAGARVRADEMLEAHHELLEEEHRDREIVGSHGSSQEHLYSSYGAGLAAPSTSTAASYLAPPTPEVQQFLFRPPPGLVENEDACWLVRPATTCPPRPGGMTKAKREKEDQNASTSSCRNSFSKGNKIKKRTIPPPGGRARFFQ